jgi:hypothetical protein
MLVMHRVPAGRKEDVNLQLRLTRPLRLGPNNDISFTTLHNIIISAFPKLIGCLAYRLERDWEPLLSHYTVMIVKS